MTIDTQKLENLCQALDEQVHDGVWRKVLHPLAVTGVADNQQLIRATGLNRDKLRRTLEKMTAASSGFPPLFSVYDQPLKRGGERGIAPRIYRLGESGAALCKADGMTNAHPCHLEEPRAILHGLGMLDVHLAAQAAGLTVATDQKIFYADGRHIRPDNVVGNCLYESEQDASSDYLNRILRSLENKVDFFNSEKGKTYAPIVRMLVDLPRGKLWQKTLTTWRQAIEISREKCGSLPFQLLVIPLNDFLANPDWSGKPEAGRWVDLTETSTAIVAVPSGKIERADLQMPQFSNRERRMILLALYQDLKEHGVVVQGQPQPDVEFLYTMRLIYAASYDPFAPALQRSGVPYDSLYLLQQYLLMNPALHEQVERAIQMDARRIHWNQSTTLHRMQVAIDTFLAFHGWQSGGPLRAYSYTPDYQTRGPRNFGTVVEITNPEILMPEETGIVPGKQEVTFLESALAWVLTALFAHSKNLGLRKPPFW